MKNFGFASLAGLFVLGLCSNVIDSSPINGQHRDAQIEIGSGRSMEFLESYRGGRRACVIVAGNPRSANRFKVEVYDEDDELTVSTEQSDIAAVVWYPPRGGRYKIRIENRGAVDASCSIAWK